MEIDKTVLVKEVDIDHLFSIIQSKLGELPKLKDDELMDIDLEYNQILGEVENLRLALKRTNIAYNRRMQYEIELHKIFLEAYELYKILQEASKNSMCTNYRIMHILEELILRLQFVMKEQDELIKISKQKNVATRLTKRFVYRKDFLKYLRRVKGALDEENTDLAKKLLDELIQDTKTDIEA